MIVDKYNINTELFYLSGKKERRLTHMYVEVVCKKCSYKWFAKRCLLNTMKRCPDCYSLGDIYERINNRYLISESGCHEWTGSLSKDGYARIKYKGKLFRVAKKLLEKRLNRKIKRGYETCHTCNNRKCINIGHLYEGTHKQNGEDMSKAGSLSGEKGSNAKITERAALKIKMMLKEDISMENISKELNIPYSTVINIKYGGSWKWLKI